MKEIGHEIAILMLCADSKHIVKLNSVHETKSETALVLELLVYFYQRPFCVTTFLSVCARLQHARNYVQLESQL